MDQEKQEKLIFGIAGGKGEGLLFKKGQIVRKINGDKLVEELLEEIDKY